MPCDSNLQPNQTPAQRFAEVLDATTRLRALLAQGKVTVRIGQTNGALALVGWSDAERKGISDVCAYRTISQSWEMRQAIARAETMAGRKLNVQSVSAGVHSHDGGRTWHPGH